MTKPTAPGCPFRIGSRVTIKPSNKYAADWRGNYAVVMVEWTYNKGAGHGINIGIASDEEINRRSGWTDGWSPDDLLPAIPLSAGGPVSDASQLESHGPSVNLSGAYPGD